jgi:hypothetical protein
MPACNVVKCLKSSRFDWADRAQDVNHVVRGDKLVVLCANEVTAKGAVTAPNLVDRHSRFMTCLAIAGPFETQEN